MAHWHGLMGGAVSSRRWLLSSGMLLSLTALAVAVVGTAKADEGTVIEVGAGVPVYMTDAAGDVCGVMTADVDGVLTMMFANDNSPTKWSQVVYDPALAVQAPPQPVAPPNIPVLPNPLPPIGGVVGGTVFGAPGPFTIVFTMPDGRTITITWGVLPNGTPFVQHSWDGGTYIIRITPAGILYTQPGGTIFFPAPPKQNQ